MCLKAASEDRLTNIEQGRNSRKGIGLAKQEDRSQEAENFPQRNPKLLQCIPKLSESCRITWNAVVGLPEPQVRVLISVQVQLTLFPQCELIEKLVKYSIIIATTIRQACSRRRAPAA